MYSPAQKINKTPLIPFWQYWNSISATSIPDVKQLLDYLSNIASATLSDWV